MSTSTNLLDQNSNANNVDIMVFEPSLLFPPCRSLGGIDDMVQNLNLHLEIVSKLTDVNPWP